MNHYVTGTTIKRLREEMHITQIQLAEQLNVSDKTISKWETCKGLLTFRFWNRWRNRFMFLYQNCSLENRLLTATEARI